MPPALESLVHRLLEKEPGHRPEDAGALVAALESVRDGGPGLATAAAGDPTLERARTDFARSVWRDAYASFSAAAAAGALDAPDLERLAEAAC